MSIYLDEHSKIMVLASNSEFVRNYIDNMLSAGSRIVALVDVGADNEGVLQIAGSRIPVLPSVGAAVSQGVNVAVLLAPGCEDIAAEAIRFGVQFLVVSVQSFDFSQFDGQLRAWPRGDLKLPTIEVNKAESPSAEHSCIALGATKLHRTALSSPGLRNTQLNGTLVIGPGSSGIFSPGLSLAGDFSTAITCPGPVGIVSDSRDLAEQAMHYIKDVGVSTVVDLGPADVSHVSHSVSPHYTAQPMQPDASPPTGSQQDQTPPPTPIAPQAGRIAQLSNSISTHPPLQHRHEILYREVISEFDRDPATLAVILIHSALVAPDVPPKVDTSESFTANSPLKQFSSTSPAAASTHASHASQGFTETDPKGYNNSPDGPFRSFNSEIFDFSFSRKPVFVCNADLSIQSAANAARKAVLAEL